MLFFIGWRSFVHFTAYDDFNDDQFQEIVESETIVEAEETAQTDPLDPRLKSLFYMRTATLADIQELLATGIDINSRDKDGGKFII